MIKSFTAVLLACFPLALFAGDTVGFYRFKEKGSGESAVGVTIVNSADAADHAGTVTATESGTVKFSDDVPGRYFFELASSGQQPYAEDIGSLCFSGSEQVKGKSGNVAFEKINEIISASEGADYTIEFFFKPENAYGGGVSILNFDDGRYNTKDTTDQLTAVNLWYPIRGGEGTQLRIGAKQQDPWMFIRDDNIDSLFGSWHHMALVMNGGSFSWYLDYNKKYIYNGSGGQSKELVYKQKSEGPLKFGCDNFQGKLCALRVSSAALGTDRFLRATDYPRCKTLSHLTFEEFETGATLGSDSIGNIASQFGSFTGKGDGKAGGDGVLPVVVDKVFRTKTFDGSDLITRNFRSVRLSVCDTSYTTSANFLNGSYIEIPASRHSVFNESFTMEGYFKYDPDGVLEKINSLSNPRYRMYLLGMSHSGKWAEYAWMLYYDLGADKLCLIADLMWTSSEGKTVHNPPTILSEKYTGGLWKGGARRHLAVTCDMDDEGGVVFTAYCDGVEVLKLDSSEITPPEGCTAGARFSLATQANVRYSIGANVNASSFNGWVDDIRITQGVLPPSAFLVETNRYGTVMTLR